MELQLRFFPGFDCPDLVRLQVLSRGQLSDQQLAALVGLSHCRPQRRCFVVRALQLLPGFLEVFLGALSLSGQRVGLLLEVLEVTCEALLLEALARLEADEVALPVLELAPELLDQCLVLLA